LLQVVSRETICGDPNDIRALHVIPAKARVQAGSASNLFTSFQRKLEPILIFPMHRSACREQGGFQLPLE